ncbi:PD-(D/E)XK nuclease family transposase [Clostridium tepidiprofundi DSM 19306]|uniref:PD-(D/E)XK nuclease family transposase n=1 Tax=Clostridium tepidiprofundi DSM 19306 TaxID=1121338 RepID=A0A151AST0_9CLOT|nr:PD-(D/E)XK nuclease family transposase [Clostridium tepidiprofundi DSM 19306]
MCRLNPKVDFVFKKLFGSEENKDILISFINSVLSEDEQIADIEASSFASSLARGQTLGKNYKVKFARICI